MGRKLEEYNGSVFLQHAMGCVNYPRVHAHEKRKKKEVLFEK
jgi:hypothetical protein